MICLLVGGLGNNKGAVLGAFLIELVYDGLRFLGDFSGGTIATQLASLRIMIIAFILIFVMLKYPRGILGGKE
jgi:branched-chain amino acid transport system permease protein